MASNPSKYKTIHSDIQNENYKVIEVNNIPNYDIIEYNLEDTDDEEKYIKDIENIVRKSFEYQTMVKYLRENMNMNKCSFFEGISNKDTFKIKIHIHHSPITLYEIVVIILGKRKFYRESLDIEDIAKEAVYVHYCLLIGLIPLCETVHQLVHNEFLFVPNTSVMGKYNDFLEMYDPWVPVQLKQKYKRLEDFTNTYNEAENMNILQPHYIYLNLEGVYKFPKYEDIMEYLNIRMINIKNNSFSLEPRPLVYFYDENGKVLT